LISVKKLGKRAYKLCDCLRVSKNFKFLEEIRKTDEAGQPCC